MKGFQGRTEDTVRPAADAENAKGTDDAGGAERPPRGPSSGAGARRVETAMAQGPAGRSGGARSGEGEAPGGGRSAAEALRRFGYLLLRAVAVLAAFAAMVAFAVVLAQLTLTPMPGAVEQTHTNLQPGWSLRHYLDAPAREALQQVGGNIALGVPFGVLLPTLFPGSRGVLRTVLMAAAAMLLVEVVQGALITGRAFDIDDVILNTTGALLGYLFLGRRMSRAIHGLGKE
ncbi:VanZ family protein [Streptomonospora nanhaiensis]|uniref:VanZ-like domain-containing protein n=1 Tax=Streptomonospora nanhaiensis TaxID=1323731 RepID=A0A853BPV5_9ACTN|nr:VanZ family protein [Streptomonospora nanhaiensis]MBV2365194.1 VanZ family protein [Streptomonospora nanhaiensis]MBX9387405.1 VanZ family protein [Streptomonospora nanhaiensis]NYI97468.1 hypothetical protein [Streptomonospora nanhaiensis]